MVTNYAAGFLLLSQSSRSCNRGIFHTPRLGTRGLVNSTKSVVSFPGSFAGFSLWFQPWFHQTCTFLSCLFPDAVLLLVPSLVPPLVSPLIPLSHPLFHPWSHPVVSTPGSAPALEPLPNPNAISGATQLLLVSIRSNPPRNMAALEST